MLSLSPCAEVITEICKCLFVAIFQRFIFKSQVVATNKYDIKKGKDFVWVTKAELLEYFPEQAAYLDKMIICLV